MPELPEVETIRLSLINKIKDQTIKEIISYHPDVLINSEDLPSVNWIIQDIRRRGKYLLFDLEQVDSFVPTNTSKHTNKLGKNVGESGEKSVMIIHLRMTGKLLLEDYPVEPAKHTHVRFLLENGAVLDFNDVRRFGRVTLYRPGEEIQDKGYASLGPEPLGPDFTREYFLKTCQRFSRSKIKSLLLNQKAIAGIGNIYADETLFRAGINPSHRAGDISKKRLIILHQKISEVIAQAIGHRGTSFRDYVDGLGQKGSFQLQLAVYQKDGQDCPVCQTTIQKMKISGRSTHYCPYCQIH